MKNLKFWRQESGLTQIDLAIASGVPRVRIQLFEAGSNRLSEEDIKKICNTLKKLPSDLGITEPENKGVE